MGEKEKKGALTGDLGAVTAPKGLDSVAEVQVEVDRGKDPRTQGIIQGNQQGLKFLRKGMIVQVNITPTADQ